MKFSFQYTGLRVTDLAAARRFFVDGLGMKVESESDVPETGGKLVYLTTEDGRQQLELNWYPPGSTHATRYEPGEALDHLGFGVHEGALRDAIKHLEAHGGKLRIEPFKEGQVTLAYVDSPDGHTVEIWEKKSP